MRWLPGIGTGLWRRDGKPVFAKVVDSQPTRSIVGDEFRIFRVQVEVDPGAGAKRFTTQLKVPAPLSSPLRAGDRIPVLVDANRPGKAYYDNSWKTEFVAVVAQWATLEEARRIKLAKDLRRAASLNGERFAATLPRNAIGRPEFLRRFEAYVRRDPEAVVDRLFAWLFELRRGELTLAEFSRELLTDVKR